MATRRRRTTEPAEQAPSVEERQGMRAHDAQGNVRPADGRHELHRPDEESQYVRTDIGNRKA